MIIRSISVVFIYLALIFGQKAMYMEQKIETSPVMGQSGKSEINKTWMLDDRVRVEGPENIMIFRFDKGVVWTVMTKKKQYFEMTVQEMEKMAQMGIAMMQGREDVKMQITKTGNTKKIGDWNCYEVVAKSPMMTQTMWISDELPFKKADYYKFFKNMPEAKKLADLVMDYDEIKGYPVRTESEMNMMGMKIKSSSELLTIREENAAAKLFELPEGFKQIENPMKMMQNPNFGQ